MEQYNYELESPEILEKAIGAMKEREKKGGNLLILLFHGSNEPEIIARDAEKLSRAFPKAAISGMSCSGGIRDGHQVLGLTVVSFLFFEKTKVSVFAFNLNQMLLDDASRRALELFRPMKNLAGLAVLNGIDISGIAPFLKKLDLLPSSVAIFGGTADSYTAGGDAYVIAGNQILGRSIVCISFEGPVSIDVQMNLGWQPLGKAMTITAMEGDRIIKELDHEPAANVYLKYLGIKNMGSFIDDALSFPLIVMRNTRPLARLPDSCREDGALGLAGNCYLGEQVRLAYGDPNEIVQRCRENTRKLAAFAPEGILIFSCITRRLFLKEGTDKVLSPYGELSPVAGGYCHGEISRNDGKTSGLNMTLVAAAFREGGAPSKIHEISEGNIDFDTGTLATIQRLASFITVSSAEQEETNKKLEEANAKLADANRQLTFMASHDGLTGLLNRETIEFELRNLAGRTRDGRLSFSALMMDLDNFKAINDTFGHDEGDRVLCELASILKREIPLTALAGRWGGDEFVVLLPGYGTEDSMDLAELLRKAVSHNIYRPDGQAVSISLGIARASAGENAEAFYHRMDKALYLAKRSGKNKTALVEE